MPISSSDRIRGALLGLALGDAMGAPVDGMSHQNVRTHYRGIKGLTADEKRRDLAVGQGTAHTQRARALARLLAGVAPGAGRGWNRRVESGLARELVGTVLRRAAEGPWGRSAAAPACAAPFGVWALVRGASDVELASLVHHALRAHGPDTPAVAAAIGMARAVALALDADAASVDGVALFGAVWATVARVEDEAGMGAPISTRLAALAPHLDETPLDLQDRCNGTGDRADEAFPFALAMVARAPELVEATLLSAVNVGGAAAAVGAMTGSLLGALHGWSAFPADWRAGLEGAAGLAAEADALGKV